MTRNLQCSCQGACAGREIGWCCTDRDRAETVVRALEEDASLVDEIEHQRHEGLKSHDEVTLAVVHERQVPRLHLHPFDEVHYRVRRVAQHACACLSTSI